MKTLPYIFRLTLVVAGLVVSSCDKHLDTGDDLSLQDKEFINKLGILDGDERIILFDSQGGGFNGLETSGNFFTDKRIASYWIDKRDSAKTNIDYAFYADIDTIWRYPKYKSLTYASYLEVHRRDGTKFKVYVSSDSVRTWDFFNRALEEWSRKNVR
ncbi:MAG: hypothetical protein QM762_13620 [Chryseolinea sp.]